MKKLFLILLVLLSMLSFSQSFPPVMDSCINDSVVCLTKSLMYQTTSKEYSKEITLVKRMYGIRNKKDKQLFYLTNTCFFLSGAVRGLNETIIYSYPAFEKHFPSANPMWWNPMKSSSNNYPKGLLFQTALIAPKDAKQCLDFFQNNLLYVCIPLQLIDIHELRKLTTGQLVSRWITPIALRSLGFEIIHKGFFGL